MNDELYKWENGIFLGVEMRQRPADLWYWEQFFLHFPIERMIELGTGSGGLSLFFLLQSIQYDFEFYTFDTQQPDVLEYGVGGDLEFGEHFYQGDVFGDMQPEVLKLIDKREGFLPILLFCDDGWKPREVQTFAPYLKPRDYLAAHDWETEIHPKDVPYNILEDITHRVYPEAKSLTRWFVRIPEKK